MTVCLAIDAGGTSTRAVLVAPDGTCVGYGRAGGGNPVSWGPEAAARSVAEAVAAAVEGGRSRGYLPPADAGAVRLPGPAVMAMAGSSAAPAADGWTGVLAGAGVAADSVRYESDLLATFCAGTAELHGYAVVAGTGSSAVRVIDGAVDGTTDGLGWLLGDGGSGFWIGHRAVRAALAAMDGRGAVTTLSELVLDALGIPEDVGVAPGGRPERLGLAVDALYRMRPVELSRFAVLAMAAAAAGDRVAAGILAEAERRLVDSLSAVHLPGHDGPVVLGGGIARRLPGFDAVVVEVVRSWSGDPLGDVSVPEDATSVVGSGAPSVVVVGSGAPSVVVVEDGSVGAGVLALRHAGFAVDHAVFGRLSTSVAELSHLATG